MKKIEATIAPFNLETVRDALLGLGVDEMNVSEVKSLDPHAHPGWYRGIEYVVWFAPRYRIELVVRDDQVDECVDVIRRSALTDDAGPGELVVLPVEDAIRVRTGERVVRDAARIRRPVKLRPVRRVGLERAGAPPPAGSR